MHGLLGSKRAFDDSDWGFQSVFADNEYSPSAKLGSNDKVLSVDALSEIAVQGNVYRQIHEDERRLAQLIGQVKRSVRTNRTELLRTTGIVDARTKTRLYLTVKSKTGNPEQLVLSRDICLGRVPVKGDFVTYTIFQLSDGELTHTIELTCPPVLSSQEEASIDARINKLSF